MALEDLFFTLKDYTFLINLNIGKSIYISDVKGAKLLKNDQNKAPIACDYQIKYLRISAEIL